MKKTIVWNMPTQLMVEPTNACNLSCPLCVRGSGNLKRKSDRLSMELYYQVIDELGPYLTQVLLWNQGEPFLHPQFLEMVAYARKKGIFTLTSTNGNLLPSVEEVCESGLHAVIFSLDAASPEVYLKYRQGGNFQQVVSNIRDLIVYKSKKGYRLPIIILQMVVTRFNEHEIDSFEIFGRSLGVDLVVYKTAEIVNPEERAHYQPRNQRYRRYRDSESQPEGNCKKLWYQPVLNADGSVAICCFDKSGEIKIGDLDEGSSFKDLWFSERFMRIRDLVRTGRDKIPVCSTCSSHLKLIARLKSLKAQESGKRKN